MDPPLSLPLVFTTADAVEAGFTRGEIRGLVRRNAWVRLTTGCFATKSVHKRLAGSPAGRNLLAAAAATLVTNEPTWASHGSGLIAHGLAVPTPISDRATVTADAPRGTVRRYPTFDLWPSCLPEHHRTVVNRVRSVTAARAVVDAGRHCSPAYQLAIADSALRLQRATPAEFDEVIGHCTGWPGIKEVRRTIQHANGRRQSVLESVSYAAFIEFGLPLPESQVPIRDDWGDLIGIVDFLWRDHGVIGEADGAMKYREDLPGAQPRETRLLVEKRRQEWLEQRGFVVVRWDWRDVTTQKADLVRRLQAALARTSRPSHRS
jgi:hypothetical protein